MSIKPISKRYILLDIILIASLADATIVGITPHVCSKSAISMRLSTLSSTTNIFLPSMTSTSLCISFSKSSHVKNLNVVVNVAPFT